MGGDDAPSCEEAETRFDCGSSPDEGGYEVDVLPVAVLPPEAEVYGGGGFALMIMFENDSGHRGSVVPAREVCAENRRFLETSSKWLTCEQELAAADGHCCTTLYSSGI